LPISPSTRSFGISQPVEEDLAGGRGADAELVLALADREALVLALDEERGDPLVPLRRVHVREHEEDARLRGVRDPELVPLEDEGVALGPRAALEREGVGAGARLGETVRDDRVLRGARQVLLLLRLGAVPVDRVVDERVLHVHEHADRGVRGRDLLDRDAGLEEAPARAPVRLGDVDPHDAHLEELREDRGVVLPFAVHRVGARGDLRLRELAHGIAEEGLLLAQDRKR
jgi:hypothetical protein